MEENSELPVALMLSLAPPISVARAKVPLSVFSLQSSDSMISIALMQKYRCSHCETPRMHVCHRYKKQQFGGFIVFRFPFLSFLFQYSRYTRLYPRCISSMQKITSLGLYCLSVSSSLIFSMFTLHALQSFC